MQLCSSCQCISLQFVVWILLERTCSVRSFFPFFFFPFFSFFLPLSDQCWLCCLQVNLSAEKWHYEYSSELKQHVQILLCPQMQMICPLMSPGLLCAPLHWTESLSCWPRWTGEGLSRRAGEMGAVTSAWRESAHWNSGSACMAVRTMTLGTTTA